ncbi:hypothetical protein FF100_34320 [Methylobacterium terricola]|uniref:DUF6894 domain-containing protein n=1 Tax=Methylobacterium terricola TaxID=2583531 RepID=A0A5C4L808_9HYPH|nr:hypothetical protein [Methylobacterium terricola]TNC06526.1 hypothetical protein FF100_34320 [Methylobacterium terricola]
MPLYFIDTDDDVLTVYDDQGQDLPGPKVARDMAHLVLPDMARQKLPDSDRRTFKASVRDESGTVLYVATLTLVGEWKVEPPAS